METLIPKLYKEFGIYVNSKKMLPNNTDGLIPVWRRILVSTNIIAKNEYVKSATVFGYCIGHFHPHSEAISGSAEQLVQSKFIDGKGNWGTNIGIEPIGCAAPRYTSLKMNPLISDLAFKYVDDVDWEIDELEKEPQVLPAMIPFCLFTKYEFNMIAFGFKTEIPSYQLSDLIKRLLFILGKGKKITPKPYIIGCDIKSPESEVEKLLTTKGKQTIRIAGRYTERPENFQMYVQGWSPRSSFTNVFNRIDSFKRYNLLSSGDISYIDESTEAVGTKIRFEVAKARNRSTIYDKLKESITDRLNTNISYHMYAVDVNANVVETTVDEMLLNAYNNFVNTLKKHFIRRIKEIQEQINDLILIEQIKPHISSVMNLDNGIVISKLAELSNVSIEDVENIITKYRIKKLLTVKTDLTSLKLELSSYEKDLESPDQYAIDLYNQLLKRAMTDEKEEPLQKPKISQKEK